MIYEVCFVLQDDKMGERCREAGVFFMNPWTAHCRVSVDALTPREAIRLGKIKVEAANTGFKAHLDSLHCTSELVCPDCGQEVTVAEVEVRTYTKTTEFKARGDGFLQEISSHEMPRSPEPEPVCSCGCEPCPYYVSQGVALDKHGEEVEFDGRPELVDRVYRQK